jgi:beta-glucosidase
VNGSYCSENVHLLHDVLKGDWRFPGFVESDWIFGTHSTVPALEAGLDIEMPSGQFFGAPMLEALASGDASEEAVDAAVRRSLRAQLCFSLDTDPPVVDETIPGSEAHAELAQQVAEQAIVLLKNDGPTLPLARATTSSLVVVGTVADTANLGDTGSSSVVPPHVDTPLAGITQAAGSATDTHVAGPPLDAGDAAAIAAADAAIVVVGLTKDDEGEGQITHGDRDSLVLPRDQDAFVAAVAALNPRTIVVLQGSGPVLMPWLNDVPAVLETWYLGQEGGTALGEVLFGDVAPTGKLPLSFPAAESDLPPFDNVSTSVTYDYWHGYRHLDRNGTTPVFPFGFGLTYTTFAFSNLVVTPAQVPAGGHVRIAVDITADTSGGTDVVQLYVGYQGSAVERAPRDLKAFARVAASPGTPTTVVFDLPTANLAYWDVSTSQWVIEPITYDVHVGDSSRDTPVSASFTVTPF